MLFQQKALTRPMWSAEETEKNSGGAGKPHLFVSWRRKMVNCGKNIAIYGPRDIPQRC